MFQVEEQVKKLAALTGVMVMAALEAWAQETQAQSGAAPRALPPADRKIVVSIPDKKLAVIESGKVVKIFPTAVGAAKSPSPTGSFEIVARIPDPTWYTKGKIVPPGKANPLGTRWLGLSKKGYGIHGTNRPSSIGHNASHGCIRMRNQDVEELFGMVALGDPVELIGEHNAETDAIFGPGAATPAVGTTSSSTEAAAPATALGGTSPAPAVPAGASRSAGANPSAARIAAINLQ